MTSKFNEQVTLVYFDGIPDRYTEGETVFAALKKNAKLQTCRFCKNRFKL